MFSYHVCELASRYIVFDEGIIKNLYVFELPFSLCNHELLREWSEVCAGAASSQFDSVRCADHFRNKYLFIVFYLKKGDPAVCLGWFTFIVKGYKCDVALLGIKGKLEEIQVAGGRQHLMLARGH